MRKVTVIGAGEIVNSIAEKIAKKPKYAENVLVVNSKGGCLLYTSPSPRDRQKSRMPSSA